MSREKFCQRISEHLEDFLSDQIVDAMRPVAEAQDAALDLLRKYVRTSEVTEGSLDDQFDALEEKLSDARGLFKIGSEDFKPAVERAVDDEIDDEMVEKDEVERQVVEARETSATFLELLGISEHEQALAENLDADDKLSRWLRYVPSFRAKILQLATRVCDEDDASATRPAYVWRGGHDVSPSSDARSVGWHRDAVAALNPKKPKKTRGAK